MIHDIIFLTILVVGGTGLLWLSLLLEERSHSRRLESRLHAPLPEGSVDWAERQ